MQWSAPVSSTTATAHAPICWCTPSADGGLRGHVPARPGCITPHIRFLFIAPQFRIGLPCIPGHRTRTYEVTRHARRTRSSSGARRGLIAQRPLQRRVSPQIGKLRGRLYTRTVMVPLWLEKAMPTTLTLKNIPDEVYERLKVAAEAHRRSLNSEAIVCLETVLTPTKIAPSERLARARQLRAGLSTTKFRARDIDTLKRQGRP